MDLIKYQIWVDEKWKLSSEPDITDSGHDFNQVISINKENSLNYINSRFTKKPHTVICWPNIVYEDLPKLENMIWPDPEQINLWLNKNMNDEYMLYDITTYIFASEADALAFKLAWS